MRVGFLRTSTGGLELFEDARAAAPGRGRHAPLVDALQIQATNATIYFTSRKKMGCSMMDPPTPNGTHADDTATRTHDTAWHALAIRAANEAKVRSTDRTKHSNVCNRDLYNHSRLFLPSPTCIGTVSSTTSFSWPISGSQALQASALVRSLSPSLPW